MPNIYGEPDTSAINNLVPDIQYEIPVPQVLYFDCDKVFTLGDVIKSVRDELDRIALEASPTLYFIRGVRIPGEDPIPWTLIWEYLVERKRVFNIVLRGYFTPSNVRPVLNSPNFNIILSGYVYSGNESIPSIKEFCDSQNFKYELI